MSFLNVETMAELSVDHHGVSDVSLDVLVADDSDRGVRSVLELIFNIDGEGQVLSGNFHLGRGCENIQNRIRRILKRRLGTFNSSALSCGLGT